MTARALLAVAASFVTGVYFGAAMALLAVGDLPRDPHTGEVTFR